MEKVYQPVISTQTPAYSMDISAPPKWEGPPGKHKQMQNNGKASLQDGVQPVRLTPDMQYMGQIVKVS